jgi:2-amino-4-hydroxy-6-hydroxymethyldihydropteridine diphosphokinase
MRFKSNLGYTSPMPLVVIGMGSNLGDRLGHLNAATCALKRVLGSVRVSHVYETAPMYVADQPSYFNAAISGQTELGPLALLALLKQLEREIGRKPAERYGPREIDLDLLLYGSLQLRSECARKLVVPHPKTPERRFVLAPLADLDAEMILPGLGKVAELLARTEAQAHDVHRIADAALSIHCN